MICILKLKPVEAWSTNPEADHIAGWMLADDEHDARRQAEFIGEMELAQELYRREILPRGKHRLTSQYVALVS